MRTPWHLWLVGIVSLLWNAAGALDYVMTQFRFEPYVSQFTPEQRNYIENFPAWVEGSWALAVWLSILGSLLLLARSRFAGTALGLALIFITATSVHSFGLAEVPMNEIAGPAALSFSLLVILVAAGLWIYARSMRRRGVLS